MIIQQIINFNQSRESISCFDISLLFLPQIALFENNIYSCNGSFDKRIYRHHC